ncbi:hypothetical protein MCHIJ_23860 [Mycolicibacterium chitae]|uniref:Secreted protein n=1 Tax=Mycolicibacterium chitae TaxID=1792 RepID=A0A448I0J7_MYCCI|nr:hypothetical protein [Mycolicibacterium chitae]MCV7107645.1 hypothetical protein [Mycolicibacterium chitae]BBZ02949.1 hypothetical protein MCHIJ_23860 [Mycolicibacterium chitae]VEG46006.1 Uncharacterised protein [Mycolicibacterium chitae]
MKNILRSAAAVSGFAALTIGLAAPAVAEPTYSADTVQMDMPTAPKGPNGYDRDDRYPYHDFGIAKHPYYDSLLPRPKRSAGVLPGESPGQVPLGPIVGRR